MPEPIIKIENVSKRFGKHLVLSDINLEIDGGEIFGIIGASGSGKTTMLNLMIGFLEPEIGDILFKPEQLIDYTKAGTQYRSIYRMPKTVKRFFGFAAQLPSFYTKLTVRENLEYFGRLHGLKKDALEHNIKNLLNKHKHALTLSRHYFTGTYIQTGQNYINIFYLAALQYLLTKNKTVN